MHASKPATTHIRGGPDVTDATIAPGSAPVIEPDQSPGLLVSVRDPPRRPVKPPCRVARDVIDIKEPGPRTARGRRRRRRSQPITRDGRRLELPVTAALRRALVDHCPCWLRDDLRAKEVVSYKSGLAGCRRRSRGDRAIRRFPRTSAAIRHGVDPGRRTADFHRADSPLPRPEVAHDGDRNGLFGRAGCSIDTWDKTRRLRCSTLTSPEWLSALPGDACREAGLRDRPGGRRSRMRSSARQACSLLKPAMLGGPPRRGLYGRPRERGIESTAEFAFSVEEPWLAQSASSLPKQRIPVRRSRHEV